MNVHRPVALVIGSAAFLCAACAAPQRLPVQTATAAVLDRPYPEGTTPGMCANEADDNRTALMTCPSAVRTLIDSSATSKLTSDKHILHDWAFVRVNGSGLFPTVQGSFRFAMAHETLIYNTYQLGPWKDDASESSLVELMNMCANRAAAPFRAIVTGESSGCARVDFQSDASVKGATWRLDALARSGTNWGIPKDFWFAKPNEPDAPATMSCDTRVAIRVQMLSLDNFCSQVVVPMQLRKLSIALEKANEQIAKLVATIESLRKAAGDARGQVTEEMRRLTALVAEKEGQVAQLRQEVAKAGQMAKAMDGATPR